MKITKKSGVELTSEYKILYARTKKFDKMITNRLVILSNRYVKKIPGAMIKVTFREWENEAIVTKLEYIRSIELSLKECEPKQLTLDLTQLQPLK